MAFRVNSCAQTLLAPNAICEFVRREYGIPPNRCLLFERGFNDTYLVEGEHCSHVAQLLNSTYSNTGSWEAKLSAVNRIRTRGGLVPHFHHTISGANFAVVSCPEGERILTLSTLLKSTPLRLNSDTSFQLGKYLAHFHVASDVSVDGIAPLDVDALWLRSAAALSNLFGNTAKWLNRIDAIMEIVVTRLAGLASSANSGAWGFVHGDSFHNVIVDPRGIVYFSDFEHSMLFWRAFDIAHFSWAIAIRSPLWKAEYETENNHLLWNSFVAGYASVRSLDERELIALPAMCALRSIWDLDNQLVRAPFIGHSGVTRDTIDQLLAIAEMWAELDRH